MTPLELSSDAITFEDRQTRIQDISRLKHMAGTDTAFLLLTVERFQNALLEIAKPPYGKIYDQMLHTPQKIARTALGIHREDFFG